MGSPAAPLSRRAPLKWAPSPGVIDWGIESKLHWVRDMACDEDRSQIRTGRGAQAMAGPATSASAACGSPAGTTSQATGTIT